ncbi:hypothetical protein [Rothia sp. P4278]|uniref:hypothetical protein n=1 Tax=Rothia sp. P4278 TaxID=3402658 RepID=UPI003AEC6704
MSKKSKNLYSLFAAPVSLFVLYLFFIGLQHFFILFIATIAFGVLGYLIFRFLPRSIAYWLSFALWVFVFAYGVAGDEVWHKSMVMIIPGFFPGVHVGSNQREKIKIIER